MKKTIITLAIIATAVFTRCSKESSPAPTPAATVADYAYTGANGPAPCTVQFINASSNATSYYWDFGDNGISTATNPSHTFINSGVYTVKLTAKGAGGSNQTTQTINIGTAYTKCFIKSVLLIAMPYTDASGSSWDIGSGPDVFFNLDDNNNASLFNGSSTKLNDITLNSLPITWTLTTPMQVAYKSDFTFFRLWDYDSLDPNDFIDGFDFAINDFISGSNPYPDYVEHSTPKGTTVRFYLKWQ